MRKKKYTNYYYYHISSNAMSCIIILFFLLITGNTICASWFSNSSQPQGIIILSPAGDTHYSGRHIGDSFERGITLWCVEQLKTMLETRNPFLKVIIPRIPGEIREPLQHAQFANRLAPDLYISFHCYQEKESLSGLWVYLFCTESSPSTFTQNASSLAFLSYDQTYVINKQTSHELAELFYHTVQHDQAHTALAKGFLQLPFKPLIGITCPAFAIELGLKNKNEWQICQSCIVSGIETALAHLHRQKKDE